MRFRILSIFWVFALLASALATFGNVGFVAFFLVIAFWVGSWRGPTLVGILTTLAIAGIFVALFMPEILMVDGRHRCARCQYNLKNLADALQQHQFAHDSLPLASKFDWPTNGNPPISWRVQLLPRLDYRTNYDRYTFSEPWDGQNNVSFTSGRLACYECLNDYSPLNASRTSYFAVVGSQTAWPPDQPRRSADIQDKASQSILLLEAGGRNVAWAKPEDIAFEESVELLTSPIQAGAGDGHVRRDGFFYKPSSVRNVAFVDGSVRSLEMPLPKELAIALLTVAGGEKIDERDFDRLSEPQLDYAKIYAFSFFVLMALLPVLKLRPFAPAMHRIAATVSSSDDGPSQ